MGYIHHDSTTLKYKEDQTNHWTEYYAATYSWITVNSG